MSFHSLYFCQSMMRPWTTYVPACLVRARVPPVVDLRVVVGELGEALFPLLVALVVDEVVDVVDGDGGDGSSLHGAPERVQPIPFEVVRQVRRQVGQVRVPAPGGRVVPALVDGLSRDGDVELGALELVRERRARDGDVDDLI